MSANKSIKIQNINNNEEKSQTVDVLYQKMGGRWYAFSLVGDDMFMGSVSEDDVNLAASAEALIETVLVEPAEIFNEVA